MSEALISPSPDLEALTAEDVVAEIVEASRGQRVCLTSSFQTEDMVVLHMVLQHLPQVPVICRRCRSSSLRLAITSRRCWNIATAW